ncbi:MAG: hypothetical protein R6W76_22735 [Caldilinea sp.]
MRNQLWFKLTAAFALIIFIGVVVTVWLTSQGTATQFEHFMVANQMVRPAVMQAALADYYQQETRSQIVHRTDLCGVLHRVLDGYSDEVHPLKSLGLTVYHEDQLPVQFRL